MAPELGHSAFKVWGASRGPGFGRHAYILSHATLIGP